MSLSEVRSPMQRDGVQMPWGVTSLYDTAKLVNFDIQGSRHTSARAVGAPLSRFFLAAPAEDEQQKIPLYSAKYFQACTIGGILACGKWHAARETSISVV